MKLRFSEHKPRRRYFAAPRALHSSLVGAALLLGALAPVVGVAPGVCAAEGPHAALVVDRGEEGGVDSYCVALPSERVSGTGLIELAADQFGVTYRFGYGGGAVCMLNGVGPTEGDCFGDHPYFWGYWRGDGSGQWQWSSSGASSTTVEDGDVEGWSWGAGNDPSAHPPPPPTTFASVCGESQPPRPKDSEKEREPAAKKGAGGSVAPGASASAEPNSRAAGEGGGGDREPKRTGGRTEKKRPERAREDLGSGPGLGDVTPAPSASALAIAPSSERAGPPAAGIAGVAVALGLAGAGAFVARRRGKRT